MYGVIMNSISMLWVLYLDGLVVSVMLGH